MFDDPTLAGDRSALLARLGEGGGVRRWVRSVPELTDVADHDDLAAWADPNPHPPRRGGTDSAGGAAAGGRDDDALVLLHLLSGVVWRLRPESERRRPRHGQRTSRGDRSAGQSKVFRMTQRG
jgi:hypothetical protein